MTTPVNEKPTYAVEERVASAYTGVGSSEPSGTAPAGSPGLETALVRFGAAIRAILGDGLSGGLSGSWMPRL